MAPYRFLTFRNGSIAQGFRRVNGSKDRQMVWMRVQTSGGAATTALVDGTLAGRRIPGIMGPWENRSGLTWRSAVRRILTDAFCSATSRQSRLRSYLCPTAKPKFFKNIMDVILYRRRSQLERAGNLLIRQTLCYKRDNLSFATREYELAEIVLQRDCIIETALPCR